MQKPEKTSEGTIVLDDDFSFCGGGLFFDYAVFCPADYGDNALIERFFKNTKGACRERYLYIPNKFSQKDEESIARLFPLFDGLYVEGTFGVNLAKRYGKELILGTGANIYNRADVFRAKKHTDKLCLSKELSLSEAKDLDGYYYSLGSIKLMDLLYCPFKKDCANCKRGDTSVLSDGGRDFVLRRVKLNGCRFEVYNCSPLVTSCADRAVVDLVTLPANKKRAALAALGDKEALKKLFPDYTTGHENKPLL